MLGQELRIGVGSRSYNYFKFKLNFWSASSLTQSFVWSHGRRIGKEHAGYLLKGILCQSNGERSVVGK